MPCSQNCPDWRWRRGTGHLVPSNMIDPRIILVNGQPGGIGLLLSLAGLLYLFMYYCLPLIASAACTPCYYCTPVSQYSYLLNILNIDFVLYLLAFVRKFVRVEVYLIYCM